jgi:hypothetical protein
MALPARLPQRAPPAWPPASSCSRQSASSPWRGAGYGAVAWGLACLGLLWLLALGAVVVPRVRLGALEVVALGGLAGLLAWNGLSVLWSLDRAQSVVEVQSGLVVLAALAMLLLFARRAAAGAVLAGLAGVCTLAAGVAVADWLPAGAPGGVGISELVGYANALGLLVAMGLILALGFAGRTRAGSRGRLLAAQPPS